VDLRLPDGGAWRALATLAGASGSHPLPALLYLPAGEDVSRGIDLGPIWVAAKPLSVDMLPEMVRALTGDLEGCTLVIGDAEFDTRRIAGEALAAVGCTVRGAAYGEEVIEALSSAEAHLVLLDATLERPGIITTLARIRAQRHATQLPVILMVPRDLPDSSNGTPDQAELDRTGAPVRRLRTLIRRLLLASSTAGGDPVPPPE
jgi:CheY-like chemotaxis protein